MPNHHARLRNQPLHQRRQRGNGLHAIVDEKYLAVPRELFFHHVLNQSLAKRGDRSLDREPIFGRRFDHAHIAQTNQRHVQRARNGRGRHGQHVHILAHLLQPLFVRHSEALLFVHDQQAEVLEFHVLGKQAVRPNQDVDFPGFHVFENLLLLFLRAEAAEHFDADRKSRETAFECLKMLESENGGRCEHGNLF